jgi:formylglycine-generating enzyme required for sulfatase activity/class 3 adenylate cyclase
LGKTTNLCNSLRLTIFVGQDVEIVGLAECHAPQSLAGGAVAEQRVQRKLAAILVADVAGFSRLMAENEESALRTLNGHRQVIDAIIARYDGRLVGTSGDGLLAEFTSPVEALRCATEIQEALSGRNALLPKDQQMHFRIGLNLGDVMVKGDDLIGDGVNVAARLEQLAEPGGICLSGSIFDQVEGKLDLRFVPLGSRTVKNIPRSIRVYRIGGRSDGTWPSAALRRRVEPSARYGLLLVAGVVAVGAAAMLMLGLSKEKPATVAIAQRTEMPVFEKSSDEVSAWARVKSSNNVTELASYLDRFGDSRHAPYVRHRLNALRSHPEVSGGGFHDCEGCPEMIVIPAGSFTMGMPHSEADRYGVLPAQALTSLPLHEVRFARPFAIGKFPVTRREYGKFVEETGYKSGAGCSALPLDGVVWRFDLSRSWREPGFDQAGDHPVVCVNWNDAHAYARWLSEKTGQRYRLPSEAEWEYAARAGSTTGRYFADDAICEFANVRDRSAKQIYSAGQFFDCDDGFVHTSPVGTFPPNGFGLHDVLGNVWQWVEDCWTPSYAGAPADGSPVQSSPCSQRVRRGASWSTIDRGDYTFGFRAVAPPEWRFDVFGFRVARDYASQPRDPAKAKD